MSESFAIRNLPDVQRRDPNLGQSLTSIQAQISSLMTQIATLQTQVAALNKKVGL